VEGPRDPKSASLVESVKKEIGEAGFQLTTAENEADIRLTNIKLLRTTLQSKSQETKVETMISAPGGAGMSFSSPLTFYNSVEEPIGPEAEDCRSSLQKLSGTSGAYDQVAAPDMLLISRGLR
jgi:hypothetical protein